MSCLETDVPMAGLAGNRAIFYFAFNLARLKELHPAQFTGKFYSPVFDPAVFGELHDTNGVMMVFVAVLEAWLFKLNFFDFTSFEFCQIIEVSPSGCTQIVQFLLQSNSITLSEKVGFFFFFPCRKPLVHGIG